MSQACNSATSEDEKDLLVIALGPHPRPAAGAPVAPGAPAAPGAPPAPAAAAAAAAAHCDSRGSSLGMARNPGDVGSDSESEAGYTRSVWTQHIGIAHHTAHIIGTGSASRTLPGSRPSTN